MKNIIWLPAYVPQQEPLERLDEELESLIMYITPTAMEEEIRRKVIQKYQTVINERFPNYQVAVFGSCCNSLYLPNSDIDLVIINTEEEEGIPAQRMSSVLSKITRKLHPHTSYLFLVKKAKIPIIKIIDYSSNIAIDISYNSAENTTKVAEFVAEKLMEYSDIKWMVLFLKQYLANRELNNNANGGLGGFAAFLLVLSFLELYPMLYKDTKLDFYTKPNSKAKLLIDFFHFYGRILDINSVGLAPTGMEGDRSVIMIDKEYYYNNIEPYETKQANLGYSRPKMLLLDPTNQANNTAKGCSLIETIFSEFNKSYDRLLTIAGNDSMQFEDGTYIGFLSNDIIAISSEEVEKRKQFKQYGSRLGLSQWDGNLHLQDDFWSDATGTKHKLVNKPILTEFKKRVSDSDYYNKNKMQKSTPFSKFPNVKQSPPKHLKKNPQQKAAPNQKNVWTNPKSNNSAKAQSTAKQFTHPNFKPAQNNRQSTNSPNQRPLHALTQKQSNNGNAKSQKDSPGKKNSNAKRQGQLFALKHQKGNSNVANKQPKNKGKFNSPHKQGNARQSTPNLHRVHTPMKVAKNKS
ncbi:hypothetical protein HK103_002881 [Boothiomyces macroporosus]|uniref:Poly(A) RNA polymerase mitochondrial-like central palm domain-containing protein n=1 Tax=Boothiomyces macroporosus TaxID=261099 RepID=A0AAD5Y4N2_9FUNG|nr:hypothetical protein HK103_002881 [Boothiomyces macroporosus]